MARINREQAGFLAYHNGREMTEHDYSHDTLSSDQHEAGWRLAEKGLRFCDLEYTKHLRVTCVEGKA